MYTYIYNCTERLHSNFESALFWTVWWMWWDHRTDHRGSSQHYRHGQLPVFLQHHLPWILQVFLPRQKATDLSIAIIRWKYKMGKLWENGWSKETQHRWLWIRLLSEPWLLGKNEAKMWEWVKRRNYDIFGNFKRQNYLDIKVNI